MVKHKLECWQARIKINSWVHTLLFIALAMNKHCYSAPLHQISPYEVCFR